MPDSHLDSMMETIMGSEAITPLKTLYIFTQASVAVHIKSCRDLTSPPGVGYQNLYDYPSEQRRGL